VTAWNERKARVRLELATLARETRDGLLSELGASPTHAQRVLVESCVVSALALRTIAARLSQAKSSSKLVDDMVRVQSQTLRALRALGVVSFADDGAEQKPEPGGALEKYLSRKAGDDGTAS
jgi:hypothetical protein